MSSTNSPPLFTQTTLEPFTEEDVQDFLSFVRHNKFLKVKETSLKLPSLKYDNLTFTIYDMRVFSRGPDDKIYASTNSNKVPDNAKIRDLITRGCFIVVVTDDLTGKNIYSNLFQGLCKFSGMTEEDDDDISDLNEKKDMQRNKPSDENADDAEDSEENSISSSILSLPNPEILSRDGEDDELISDEYTSSKRIVNMNIKKYSTVDDPFFLEPFFNATTIVNTRKENGKACHLAVFKFDYNGETIQVYVSGSKNVHTVFREEQDIPEENILHYEAARFMLEMFRDLPDPTAFTDVLCTTGLVANFEFLLTDDQHIVDYNLERNLARLLTFSGRRVKNDLYLNTYGKCVSPMEAMTWAKSLGVPVAEVCEETTMSVDNLASLIDSVRHEEKSEGSVLYFIRDSKVLGLWKLKSLWYIMFRAIREKVCRLPSDFNRKIKIRFNAIKKWVGLTNYEVLKWRHTAAGLFQYHLTQLEENSLNGTQNSIRANFAVNLRKFLEEVYKAPEDPESLEEEVKNLPTEYRVRQRTSDPVVKEGGKKKKKRNHKKRK